MPRVLEGVVLHARSVLGGTLCQVRVLVLGGHSLGLCPERHHHEAFSQVVWPPVQSVTGIVTSCPGALNRGRPGCGPPPWVAVPGGLTPRWALVRGSVRGPETNHLAGALMLGASGSLHAIPRCH